MTCTHEGLEYEAQYDAYRCSQCGELIPREDLKNSPYAVPGTSAPIVKDNDEMGPKRRAQYEEFCRLLENWLENPKDRLAKAELIRNIREPREKC